MDGSMWQIVLTVNSALWRFLIILTHTCPLVTSGCGGSWSALRGHITSPGYPSSYTRGPTCVYNITSPSTGRRIQMTTGKLDLGSSDIFQVMDSSNQVIFRKGGKTGPFILPSSTSYLVSFVRKTTFYFYGFKATWVDCGGDWTGDTGSFLSPNYPDRYHKQASCFYTIKPSSDNMILLTVEKLSLPPKQSLKVIDAGGHTFNPLSSQVEFQHYGPSSSFMLDFTVTGSVNSNGFHVTWQAVPPRVNPSPSLSSVLNATPCEPRKLTMVSSAGLKLSSTSPGALGSFECLKACLSDLRCSHFYVSHKQCFTLRPDNITSTPIASKIYQIKDFM
ncbi:embryonic protein UVS.2-like [Haliotis rubra]|uniref:embryonic protein UVS.2-like n=1 Tax=Haliotis rubra TaxID=36100 RepID=UPI001EE58D9A|nr:embryonic protein UVS.2-like [Haliotis rubra]